MSATENTQQELINGCQGLVRSLALKIHRRGSRNLDLDDLIGYGQLGLAEAARDFDPDRGVKFSTFAYYRIRGAIYDGMTKMSWFRRGRHADVKYEQMSNDLLQVQSEDPEWSAGDGLKGAVCWFSEITSTLAMVYWASQRDERSLSREAQVVDLSARAPSDVVIDGEIHQTLDELVGALPNDERTLIRTTYFEGLTLQDAARRLGISKSWASRLHAKILKRLAQSMRLLGVAD